MSDVLVCYNIFEWFVLRDNSRLMLLSFCLRRNFLKLPLESNEQSNCGAKRVTMRYGKKPKTKQITITYAKTSKAIQFASIHFKVFYHSQTAQQIITNHNKYYNHSQIAPQMFQSSTNRFKSLQYQQNNLKQNTTPTLQIAPIRSFHSLNFNLPQFVSK